MIGCIGGHLQGWNLYEPGKVRPYPGSLRCPSRNTNLTSRPYKLFLMFTGILSPITGFPGDEAFPRIRNLYPNPFVPGSFHDGPSNQVMTGHGLNLSFNRNFRRYYLFIFMIENSTQILPIPIEFYGKRIGVS